MYLQNVFILTWRNCDSLEFISISAQKHLYVPT
uniref:Uncharacterized protein n=1 Tax=Anguilla anguilla TaxID=7936 RepID=A0A0E9VFG1_ANGAN